MISFYVIISLLIGCGAGIIIAQFYFAKKIELKENEIEEMKKINSDLKTENEGILGSLNHEMRVQINSIMAMTEILEFTEPNKLQLNYLETIKEATAVMFETIVNMEDMAKNYENSDIQEKEFVIGKFLEEVVLKFNKNTLVSDIDFIIDCNLELKSKYIGDILKIKKITETIVSFLFKSVKKGKIIFEILEKNMENSLSELTFVIRNEGEKVKENIINKENNEIEKRGSLYGISAADKMAKLLGSEIKIEEGSEGDVKFYFILNLQKMDYAIEAEEKINKKAIIIGGDKTRNEILDKKMVRAGIVTETVSPEKFMEIVKKDALKERYDLFFVDYKFVKEEFFDIIKAVPDKERVVVILNRFGFRENIKFFNNFKMLKFLVEPQVDYLSAMVKLFKSSTATIGKEEIIELDKSGVPLEKKSDRKKRILLAEDNKINQKTTKIMLEKQGFEVEVANNGQEAAEKYLTEKNYDIILMDIQMPVMTGYEATAEIRKKDGRVPIIALTAYAMNGDKEKCLENGMNDYLSKPYKMSELSEIMKKYI